MRRPAEPGGASEWKSRSSVRMLLIIVVLGIPGIGWYLRHLPEVWQHIHDASFGDMALPYGFRQSVFQKLLTWCQLVDLAFLAPYLRWICSVAVLLAVAFFLSRRHWGWPKVQPRLHPVAAIGGLQLALSLCIFSLNITVDSRYLYALLPSITILFMQIFAYLPRQVVVAVVAACAIQCSLVNRVSLLPAGGLGGQATLLFPAHRDRSQYDELAEIVRSTCDIADRYNIVGIQEPSLNDNSAAFFSAKNRLTAGIRCYYTSLGYAQNDLARAFQRIRDLRTRYIVTLDERFQKTPPIFLNVVSLPVLKRIRTDSRFTPIPFRSADGVVVFRFDPEPVPLVGAPALGPHAIRRPDSWPRVEIEPARAKRQLPTVADHPHV